MKVIGIEINSLEAVLVVLEKDSSGSLRLLDASTKINIKNDTEISQIKQFRDQVNVIIDAIKPDRIAIIARNGRAKGHRSPSPFSFKLEGIIQLYDKVDVELIWPQSLHAFEKKAKVPTNWKFVYQKNAFRLAYYMLNN